MKTDRRHELHQNELADWLGRHIEQSRPYSRAIAAALIGLVVIIGVVIFVNRQSAESLANDWAEFYATDINQNPEKFVELADRHPPGTPLGDWSRLVMADRYLSSGIQRQFLDRARANEDLAKAVDLNNDVLEGTTEPALREKANFGLARAYESTNQLDKARAKYQALADSSSGTFAEYSKKRLASLDKPETKEWYAWFASQEPKPPAIQGPGEPGKKPSFDAVLPDGPDIKLPSMTEPLMGSPDAIVPEAGLPGNPGAASPPSNSRESGPSGSAPSGALPQSP